MNIKWLAYTPHIFTSFVASYLWTRISLPLLIPSSLLIFSFSKMIVRDMLVFLYRNPARSRRSTCIITGATHGIGYEIAKFFARDGYNLILVARSEEELETTKQQLLKINPSIRIFNIAKDLFAENAADELFYEAKAIEGTNNVQINFVINNVGVMARGNFLELPLTDQLGMIKLNVLTTVKLTHYFGNEFKGQIDRHPNDNTTYRFLVTSSIASLIMSPFMAVYTGTKAFVHSFALSFNEELKSCKYQGKITCTSLCPGYTLTPAFIPTGMYYTVAFALRLYDHPPRVARHGYYSLMNKEDYIAIGFMNNFAYWFIPVTWSSKLAKFFNADLSSVSPSSLLSDNLTYKQADIDLREGLAKQ